MIPNDRAFDGKNYYQEDGKTFFRYQRIEKKGTYQLRIRFVSTSSPYNQGIAIKFSKNPEFRGNVFINGVHLLKSKKKQMTYIIREGIFIDNEFEIELQLENGFIAFCNASDFLGDYPGLVARVTKTTGKNPAQFESKGFTSGFSAANLYGNAFWVESLSDTCYRFHCNDHRMDDDFDDLIFDIEVKNFEKT